MTVLKKLLLIVNPNAGTRQAHRLLPEMISALTAGGYLVTVCVTDRNGDASAFARDHAGDADLVVACGGDGTLNEVVSGLLSGGHATPVGYIPAGSTNDFAATLGFSPDLLAACETICGGAPRMLDMGRFGADRYFCYTASFGAFTSVSWSTPQNMKNILGHAAYILQGIRSLADIHPIHMRITADGTVYEDDYLFGAVCNSTSLGGILKLEGSQVDMNDGLFETLLIPFPPNLGALGQVIGALTAGNYEDPSLVFIRASSFTFEGAPELEWTLDGEEATAINPLTIQNIHNAVQLIC